MEFYSCRVCGHDHVNGTVCNIRPSITSLPQSILDDISPFPAPPSYEFNFVYHTADIGEFVTQVTPPVYDPTGWTTLNKAMKNAFAKAGLPESECQLLDGQDIDMRKIIENFDKIAASMNRATTSDELLEYQQKNCPGHTRAINPSWLPVAGSKDKRCALCGKSKLAYEGTI